MPRRRGLLKMTALTAAATPLSGCIKLPREGDPAKPAEDRDRPCWQNIQDERIELEPVFHPEREDEMVFSDDDLSRYDPYDDENYPEYKAYVDDRWNTVLFKVYVHPTVEEAETHYNENKDSYDDPDTFTGFADQAIRHDEGDYAEMTIRVSNAVGHIISYIPEEAPEDPDDGRFPPRGQVLRFAEHLHDYWAGTSSYRHDPGFCREEVKELQQPNEDD